MSDVFWLDDPKVLFNKNYITEILPPSNMSFERKLNAVTRLSKEEKELIDMHDTDMARLEEIDKT